MSRLPHIPIMALTVPSAAAPVNGNRFIGFNDQHAAAGAPAQGISDYDAAAGDAFAVTVLGTQRVLAGGPFARGAELQSGADGKAVVKAAGVKVARALQDSAGDGTIVTVLLTP